MALRIGQRSIALGANGGTQHASPIGRRSLQRDRQSRGPSKPACRKSHLATGDRTCSNCRCRMSLNQALHLVLYEGAGAEALTPQTRLQALSALLEKGYAVSRTSAEFSLVPSGHTVVMVLGQFTNGNLPSVEQTGVTIRFQDI